VSVRISLAESAVRDLDAISEVGDRLIREILASLDQLAEFPESGRVVPEFDQPWLRELVRPPFRVVYRVDRERVRVVRIWRSERLMGARP
jgi:plasmid stabilization system protein ParE